MKKYSIILMGLLVVNAQALVGRKAGLAIIANHLKNGGSNVEKGKWLEALNDFEQAGQAGEPLGYEWCAAIYQKVLIPQCKEGQKDTTVFEKAYKDSLWNAIELRDQRKSNQ